MQAESLTLYKLIILFILDKVDFPLTNAQMTHFILEKEYTNYFNVQQAISELTDASLVSFEAIRNSSYFRITDNGRETLSFFGNDIPERIRTDVLEFLKTNKYELREEVSTLANYYEGKRNEFIAHCIVTEQGSNIIELSLSFPSEEEAEYVCKNWRVKSQEIYAYLMKTLLSSD